MGSPNNSDTSHGGWPAQEEAGHELILQQARAAAPAQDDTQEPTSPDADLVTLNSVGGDAPPPAYGETYGEIRNEKEGLGTSANVTDDGRVNIRITQLNRRLSQVFTPALRQQIKGIQDSDPPPPPYIPPSLGGDRSTPPPPPLNVVIHVVGSRGDVQPFIALGKVLKSTYGHRVRLATHPTFKTFVEDNGLEFYSIGGDPSRLMAFMVNNGPGLMPGFRSLMSGDVSQRRRDVAEYIQGCWRSCYKAGDGMGSADTSADSETGARPFVADCIIANPPSFAHIHCAEKMGIPLHMMFTMPYSPTQAFPHPLANVQSNADPQLTNYISYVMIELLSWQGLGDIINRFRSKCLGLDPVSVMAAPGMLERLKVPHTYCWSPALIPKPKDWGPHISISGFYFLESNYTPDPALKAFLDAGSPPVYIGFGSIVLDDPDTMTELIFEAVKMTGQRILLSKGWGGMGAEAVPEGVFMLGNVPHDWLFKHVSCVVHHGGAGTTAAGIAAGRPTAIVPFFGDQPFWGGMVARAGAGPDPIPSRQLRAERLANAINFCLRSETLERARELADRISSERGSGSEMGAQCFHQHLPVDHLRCTLAPSRAAVWRIRRTKVRLSAFAACTLANAGLLDFNDLKLFRPQEYLTDEGPSDPFSAFATGVFRSFSGMALGLAESPSETFRAFVPSDRSRRESQASMGSSMAPAQTSSNIEARRPRTSSSSRLSDSPSPADAGLSDPPNDGSKAPVRNTRKSKSNKEFDMRRQSVAHSSKGFGRLVKSAVLAPMDISVSITKGFHNMPRAWGDETVRPNEKVTDLKSGFQAVGREFGFGMYDGLTGVVTQPWQGARKEGAIGFAKGAARGIGGVVPKTGAALWGIPSHFMKGATKEVQKLFRRSVQSHIVASRTAQGYEEWVKSSETERQDVIDSWKLVQKVLKKKEWSPEEMMRDALDARRGTGPRRDSERYIAQSAERTDHGVRDSVVSSQVSLSSEDTIPGEPPRPVERKEFIRRPIQRTPMDDTEEYETQLEQALAQSLPEQRRMASDDESDLYAEENDPPLEMDASGPSHARPSHHHDPGHLEGVTQSEFQAQQESQQREKTAAEKTEEQIVLEYVKKQSLLEAQHRRKGGSPSSAREETDDADLRQAMGRSLREH